MNFIDRMAAIFGYQKAQLNNVPDWLRVAGESEQHTVPDRQLPEAQLELYQRLSWMQIAVERRAETAAPTKFNVMTMQGEETEHIKNHPFEMLYRKPNPLMSRFEFNIATFSYYSATGNAYWWLNKSNPKAAPDEIWVLPSNKVKPVPDSKLFLKGYVYEPDDGVSIPLEAHEVVHFRRWHPLNSFVGLSPVEAFAIDAEADMAMQKWNRNLFAKDNAKLPGALAFKDPIDNSTWERMRTEIQRDHGGTSRKLMMLRNVGNGVSWIPMSVSQRDMEFLAGRTFTKEQIFSIYAPGLASMLDVNATEANSTAGKATFIEMSVYPLLVQVAEKISNDILPLYGENLTGEFEDIRVTDRAMKLAEIDRAEKFHTIDEIRQQYYQAKPIGDERGKLLVIEINKPVPTEMTEDETVEAQLPESQPEKPGEIEKPESIEEPKEIESVAEETAKSALNAAVKAERKSFKAWLKKRPTADIHEFKASHLTYTQLCEIAEEMRGVATEQPFFTLPETFTRENVAALKAMILQLDPDDDEAEQKIRMELEHRSARAIDKAFTDMINTLFPEGYGSTGAFIDPNIEANRIHQAFVEDQRLKDAVSRALIDSADLGVSVAIDQMANIGLGFDWTLAHVSARDWAIRYTDELLQQMGTTSGRIVGQSVGRWFSNGEPLSRLIADLEPVFGRKRAERIAATEVTRAAFQGSRASYRESGVIQKMVWRTARDERVCPVCGPLEGRYAALDSMWEGNRTIPAHPNCRCWASPVVENVQ